MAEYRIAANDDVQIIVSTDVMTDDRVDLHFYNEKERSFHPKAYVTLKIGVEV